MCILSVMEAITIDSLGMEMMESNCNAMVFNLECREELLTCTNGSCDERFTDLAFVEHAWRFHVVPVFLRERVDTGNIKSHKIIKI